MQKTISVINLSAITQNAKYVRSLAGGRKIYAVVKADGYGHGAARVALAIQSIVDGFCVSIIDEGVCLRVSGIYKPILVFTPPLDGDDVLRASFFNLTVTVNSTRTAVLIKNLPCHIKVNTGMNRYGCTIKELPKVLKRLSAGQILGIYSHMYAPEDIPASQNQLRLFNIAEQTVKSVNPAAVAHLAASGGILRGGEYLKDAVRPGILLYGYAPAGFSAPVSPALKVYARLAQKTPFIGGGVGYSHAKKQYRSLFTYRLGYADGFSRITPLGEGNLCMDAFINVNGGKWRLVMDNAAEYAARLGTISYEVLCSATRRSRKIYV